MKKLDIIIGIPALNEDKTISHVLSVIDGGLIKFFPDKKSLIILLDSNSTDKTVDNFLNTNTKTAKKVIKNKKIGKGRNIISLFKYSQKINPLVTVMIDADISSIKKDWVYKLVYPVLQGKTDIVLPKYKRNKFSGNITNFICRPILYGIFGKFIHQPIGGEFSFSGRFINRILKEFVQCDKGVKKYIFSFGIDIFITFTSLSLMFSLKEVDLGEKRDKPGFFHIDQIFTEVSTVLFYLIKKQKLIKINLNKITTKNFIFSQDLYSDKYIENQKKILLKYLKNNHNKIYSFYDFNQILTDKIFFIKIKNLNVDRIREILLEIEPLFKLRIFKYFAEVKNFSSLRTEKYLIENCYNVGQLIKNNLTRKC